MATDVDEGSSSADVQNRYPKLEAKHDIFLSHSGKDKNFTGLLFKRLKDRGHWPFFDIDRLDSLPPGQNASVVNVLFAAARQCRVLVVILSEEFFTNSEWPMLELSAFVQSQEELEEGKSGNTSRAVCILPVYLGLTRDQTRDKGRWEHWVKKWSEMGKQEKEEAVRGTGSGKPLIDIEQWKEALQVLADQSGKYTSCEYEDKSGWDKLLAQTVNAVCTLVSPRDFLPDPAVQGREAICHAVNGKIERSQKKTEDGVCIVGLHGMSGLGKTTVCKELCALKYCEFEGKVCYVELASSAPGSSRESREEEAIRKLTHINPRDIQKNGLGRVREEKVFLALDNLKLERDSIAEARMYLDIWGKSEGKGSVVIVTAQHIDTLGRLGIEESNCLEMPELTKDDAMNLFLSNAAPNCDLKPKDDEDIQYCLNECYFRKALRTISTHRHQDLADSTWHYHPLALKVLGAQLRDYGPNPKIWKEKLSEDSIFDERIEPNERSIFGVLRSGYGMLRDEDKLLFMDAVVFSREFLCWDRPDHHGAKFFDWMLIVHYPRSLASIIYGLQVLKERAFIVDIKEISVHDLVYEFADLEVKRDAQVARRWVYGRGDDVPGILCETPSGNCWEKVERVDMSIQHFWSRCNVCNELLLQSKDDLAEDEADAEGQDVGDADSGQDDVDAEGQDKVDAESDFDPVSAFLYHSIEDDDLTDTSSASSSNPVSHGRVHTLFTKLFNGCYHYDDTKEIIKGINWNYFSNVVVLSLCINFPLDLDLRGDRRRLRSLKIRGREVKLNGLGEARYLKWLDLRGMLGATCAEDISSLKQLQVLRLADWETCVGGEFVDLTNVNNCTRLQELELQNCGGLKAFPDLSKMEVIRKVAFYNCRRPTEVLGLGPHLPKLEELRLCGCRSLRLPNLAGLVSMQVLELSMSKFHVEQFLGLETMTRLQVLIIEGVPRLLELPQLAGLISLERLKLVYLPKVQEFPDIRHLKKVQDIEADSRVRALLMPKSDITIRKYVAPWDEE